MTAPTFPAVDLGALDDTTLAALADWHSTGAAGRLDCAGDRPGDLWRVEIHGRRAVRVTARIVWPDGSEGF